MRVWFSLLFLVVLFSCSQRDYITNPDYRLSYSTDTLRFDTIFTEKGSATKIFKIYNRHKSAIRIQSVALANTADMEFILNVSGHSGKNISNITIAAGDSLFVFVQATLAKNAADTALLHANNIAFTYNSLTDFVTIEAWGQNVENMRGTLHEHTHITSRVPVVIYDSLVVPPNIILTIEAGAKIYAHKDSYIRIAGQLKAEGSAENPIIFQADRLEEMYNALPGQWNGLIFAPTSNGNSINYCTIKNAIRAIDIMGNAELQPDLTISNSQIYTMNSHAVSASMARVNMYNTVCAATGLQSLHIVGGSTRIVHSTIANYGYLGGSRRSSSSVVITDYDATHDEYVQFGEFECYNSILVGSMSQEVSLHFKDESLPLACKFDYCLLQTSAPTLDTNIYKTIYVADKSQPLFTNEYDLDFTLDSLSQARYKAAAAYTNFAPTDMQGYSRTNTNQPDLGAYQYYEITEK